MKKYIEFDGFCPESKLKGEQVEMQLNEYDFWESEKTALQIVISEPYAVILKWRGKKQLRESSPKASDMHYGFLLTESMDIKGKEIFPYQEGMFERGFDIEEYIESVYDTEEEYNKNQFDPSDSIFKKQRKHLDKIPKDKYLDLINLYKEAKFEWCTGEKFMEFFDMLYSLQIIFPFNWTSWTEGRRMLRNTKTDYSEYSLLELSMLITTIFRSDRFDDIYIKKFHENGVMVKVFERMSKLFINK